MEKSNKIKLSCFSNIIDNLDCLKDSNLFSKERLEEMINWLAPNQFSEPKLENGKTIKNYIIHELTGTFWNNEFYSRESSKSYINREILELLLTENEIIQFNKYADRIWREQREKTNFEKAEKVKYEDYDGLIYIEGLGPEYFDNEDDIYDYLLEDCETEDTKITYGWATVGKPSCHLNLDRIIENATEEAHEGYNGPAGIEELQIAVDKFNELNKNDLTYWASWKKVILLD